MEVHMRRVYSQLLLSALAGVGTITPAFAATPAPIVPGSLTVTAYDGISDDLLSGGLNLAGLVNPVAPAIANPLQPTRAELRRRSIWTHYRGLVDAVPGGGIGLLWGPQSPRTPQFAGVPFGLIPGVEYKAYLRAPEPEGQVNNIPAAVQIPRHFDRTKPCIVAAPPSGSRSLYGGIAIAEWALFQGCAVVLGGKGTDTGFHLLGPEASGYAVDDVDGIYGPAEAIGGAAQFAVAPSARLDAYLALNPHRIATKHAHSQINPERLWGRFVLQSIEFAFWALNDHLEATDQTALSRKNTIVIAAGVSNGGGSSLRAVEMDRTGLIDGVVVTEPSIGPEAGRYSIQFGSDPPFDPAGRSTYDAVTMMGVYASCAALSPTLAGSPFFGAQPLGSPPNSLQNRCASLRDKGLVSGDTIAEQAAAALAVLRANGYAAAQDWGIPSHEALSVWRSLQATYANAYGRYRVEDDLCGVSFAAIDATLRPAPIAEAVARRLFADSVGAPPTGGVNLIADRSATGPILENFAVSRSTSRTDLDLDGALCFRYLETGERELLAGLDANEGWLDHARVHAGTRQVEVSGRMRHRPAIVIHGRRDALVFPNLNSRAYYALNQERDPMRSRLSYIEVTTGQHFDAFISSLLLGPTGVQFAPVHYYLVQAMDSMYAHLTTGAALPPSQVVRPTPRGVEPYTPANVATLLPLPLLAPAEGDRITFAGGVLTIPQ
jgi:hydroxybutyrate-dimer hydrolase